MGEEYRFLYTDDPDDAAHSTIGFGVRDFNVQQAGDNNYQALCFFVHGPDEQVVGGLIGATYFGWFYVDLLWVTEALRGRGFGGRLLALAEEKARERGATGVYLDTFSFQSPRFYENHGYRVFGSLPDFPPGHQRYFMMKEL